MVRILNNSNHLTSQSKWLPAVLHALPVTALVLCLFYYWFAIADRYIVFLYYHDMGPRYPDTSPFSDVTSSRYWMAGLVASGMVLVLYPAGCWLFGRLLTTYQTPKWWQVWIICAVPLFMAIPAITMTANHPTLPFLNAMQATVVTLLGLALALLPGQMAAERPARLIWLAADGVGMMLLLLLLPSLEDVPRWWVGGRTVYLWMMASGLLMGGVLLLVVTGLRIWLHRPIPGTVELFGAGLGVAYLLMPLLHYVSFTDGYYYISCASNFFASSPVFQVVAWLATAAIAWGVTRLRGWLRVRREASLVCGQFGAQKDDGPVVGRDAV